MSVNEATADSKQDINIVMRHMYNNTRWRRPHHMMFSPSAIRQLLAEFDFIDEVGLCIVFTLWLIDVDMFHAQWGTPPPRETPPDKDPPPWQRPPDRDPPPRKEHRTRHRNHPRRQNDWHTPVKISPCPKLRLRVVNIRQTTCIILLASVFISRAVALLFNWKYFWGWNLVRTTYGPCADDTRVRFGVRFHLRSPHVVHKQRNSPA